MLKRTGSRGKFQLRMGLTPASISTPQTSQTLPLEVPARVPHKKGDQDSTQPHRVESIKSLGDFSFSSSSTCDAILHRHRMSLQRNIAAEYDFFNGLLGTGSMTRRRSRDRAEAMRGSPEIPAGHLEQARLHLPRRRARWSRRCLRFETRTTFSIAHLIFLKCDAIRVPGLVTGCIAVSHTNKAQAL